MSNITINLNNRETFTTTYDVINLIEVFKSQIDQENIISDSSQLVIVNKYILDDDLNLVLSSLTLYLSGENKQSDLPQPMPIDKSFDDLVQEVWEKHIVEEINCREEEDERVKYAIKMATICDYLCCVLLKNFFCAYVGSWMRRNDNNEVKSFFERAGMIVEE